MIARQPSLWTVSLIAVVGGAATGAAAQPSPFFIYFAAGYGALFGATTVPAVFHVTRRMPSLWLISSTYTIPIIVSFFQRDNAVEAPLWVFLSAIALWYLSLKTIEGTYTASTRIMPMLTCAECGYELAIASLECCPECGTNNKDWPALRRKKHPQVDVVYAGLRLAKARIAALMFCIILVSCVGISLQQKLYSDSLESALAGLHSNSITQQERSLIVVENKGIYAIALAAATADKGAMRLLHGAASKVLSTSFEDRLADIATASDDDTRLGAIRLLLFDGRHDGIVKSIYEKEKSDKIRQEIQQYIPSTRNK